ncbi:MAG: hypothetical protein HXY28_11550 [Hydrogenophilaceae bacterium]|jgi:hypothetical protein|nr:hypothetical protein [Hydrogenophilaceae bacterium]
MKTEAILAPAALRLDVQLPAPIKADAGSEAVEAARAEPTALQPALLVAGELVIEIDAAAQRFVHKIFDPRSQELTLQYPSDQQLAFARGLNAYMRARFG